MKGEAIISAGAPEASVPVTVLATACTRPEATSHASAPPAPAATRNSGKGTRVKKMPKSQALCRVLYDPISISKSRVLCNPIQH